MRTHNFKDFTGEVVGCYRVLHRTESPSKSSHAALWLCVCTLCNTERKLRSTQLNQTIDKTFRLMCPCQRGKTTPKLNENKKAMPDVDGTKISAKKKYIQKFKEKERLLAEAENQKKTALADYLQGGESRPVPRYKSEYGYDVNYRLDWG